MVATKSAELSRFQCQPEGLESIGMTFRGVVESSAREGVSLAQHELDVVFAAGIKLAVDIQRPSPLLVS